MGNRHDTVAVCVPSTGMAFHTSALGPGVEGDLDRISHCITRHLEIIALGASAPCAAPRRLGLSEVVPKCDRSALTSRSVGWASSAVGLPSLGVAGGSTE